MNVSSNDFRAIRGPLKRHPKNPRYFTDDGNRAVYLTGSHTWANFQDIFLHRKKYETFDYEAYLNALVKYNHNFMRLWAWENAAWAPWTADKLVFEPMPFARTGPGEALDGGPRFDLEKWNDAYFSRLRGRVLAAREKGIYAAIMLFQGWSVKRPGLSGDPWAGHPFNARNNINGTPEGMRDADVFTLALPQITRCQERYVRKVIDTVNDLDNVLYEVANEVFPIPEHDRWQYHMLEYIRAHQATKPKQYPAGMTIGYSGLVQADNAVLFDSAADWVSPFGGEKGLYMEDPPDAGGGKVVVTDTDHLWGHGGSFRWVWKSFLRGLNPIFMDPWYPIPGKMLSAYGPTDEKNSRHYPDWEPIRKNMGYTLRYAQKLDLASMRPDTRTASSGYCLADPGQAYLAYFPGNAPPEIDLRGVRGKFQSEWLDTSSGAARPGNTVAGGKVSVLPSPFGGDSVLCLLRAR